MLQSRKSIITQWLDNIWYISLVCTQLYHAYKKNARGHDWKAHNNDSEDSTSSDELLPKEMNRGDERESDDAMDISPCSADINANNAQDIR